MKKILELIFIFCSLKIAALESSQDLGTRNTFVKTLHDNQTYEITINNHSKLGDILPQIPINNLNEYFFICTGKRLDSDTVIGNFNIDDTDFIYMVRISSENPMFDAGMKQAKDFIFFFNNQNSNVDLSDIKKNIFRMLNTMINDFKITHIDAYKASPAYHLTDFSLLPAEEEYVSPLHIVALGLKLALLLEKDLDPYEKYLWLFNYTNYDTETIKQKLNDTTGKNHDYIIPIYTDNGLFGIDTLVYILDQGFYPIGFGDKVEQVHNNLFEGNKLLTIFHDYGHYASSEVLLGRKDSELREIFSNIYKSINNGNQEYKNIDTFILALLMHAFPTDIRSKNNAEEVSDEFKDRFYLLEYFTAYQPDEATAQYQAFKMGEDTVDLIRPLQQCGYLAPITLKPRNEDIIIYTYNINQCIFNALKEATFEFFHRHCLHTPWFEQQVL